MNGHNIKFTATKKLAFCGLFILALATERQSYANWFCPFSYSSKAHFEKMSAVAAGVNESVADAVGQDLTTLLDSTIPNDQSESMSASQLTTLLEGAKLIAAKYGITVHSMNEIIGVYPRSLKLIDISGLEETSTALNNGNSGQSSPLFQRIARATAFSASERSTIQVRGHEIGHLFHTIALASAIGSSTGGTPEDREEYFDLFSKGTNYLEFEKAVTALSSPWLASMRPETRSGSYYVARLKSIIDFTLEGAKMGKVRFPSQRTFGDAYGWLMSRVPLIMGQSQGQMIARAGLLFLLTCYAINKDVGRYVHTPMIPDAVHAGKMIHRPAHFRDFVNSTVTGHYAEWRDHAYAPYLPPSAPIKKP